MKKEITANAFLKRLGRNLAKEGLRLRTARSSDLGLGPFYTVNENNCVWDRSLDWEILLKWGEEAGLLKGGESVAE